MTARQMTFWVLLAASLLAAWLVFGQQQMMLNTTGAPAAAPGPSYYYPTNLPDNAPTAWWNADDYYTNGSVYTWSDRWASLTATNTATPLVGEPANLGGHASVALSSSCLRLNGGISNAQPFTLWAVIRWHEPAAATMGRWFGNGDGGSYVYAASSETYQGRPVRFYGASAAYSRILNTNQWWLLVLQYNGAASQVWTNGAVTTVADPGARGWTNLVVGRSYAGDAEYGKASIASFGFYPALLTTNNVSNLWVWATNYYGSTNF